MRLLYHRETDSPYIEFNANPGADPQAIANGVVIGIEHAS